MADSTNPVHFVSNYWIRTDSALYIQLLKDIQNKSIVGILDYYTAVNEATEKLYANMTMGGDMMALMAEFQDATGIISTSQYSFPDTSGIDPSNPAFGILTQVIEDYVGTLSTELGVGIAVFNLLTTLLAALAYPVLVKGLIINAINVDITMAL